MSDDFFSHVRLNNAERSKLLSRLDEEPAGGSGRDRRQSDRRKPGDRRGRTRRESRQEHTCEARLDGGEKCGRKAALKSAATGGWRCVAHLDS